MSKVKLLPSYWFSNPTKDRLFTAFLQTNINTKIRLMKRIEFTSIGIKLEKSEEELFNNIKKSTRNEIRRASKEGVECSQLTNTVEGLKLHRQYYKENSLGSVSINRYVDNACVRVTIASFQSRIIAIHTYIFCEHSKIFRLLFSSTIPAEYGVERNIIGWGNRALHWHDIKYSKNNNFDVYDFGGLAVGDDLDAKTEEINRFKKSFGGEIAVYYNHIGLVRYALMKFAATIKRLKHRSR